MRQYGRWSTHVHDGSAIVWLEFLRRKSLLRFGYPDIATVSPAKRVQEYRLNFNGVSRVQRS